MNNVKITNMDNKICLVINKEQFESCRTSLSENTIYEYTNLPVTSIIIPRQNGRTAMLKELATIIGGIPNEINRTAIIRL